MQKEPRAKHNNTPKFAAYNNDIDGPEDFLITAKQDKIAPA